ncbi:hypothetical protein [Aldersonia kunmingensis]|uniref:hypothetical protein n=1 Tax=Aldersonia kunmingensis TaxID=408066 RepID=UPI000AF34E26|nr:hypothetical protein [Aldersonia kunmingensis]
MRGTDSQCSNPAPAAPVGLTATDVHLGVPGYAGTAARVTWTYAGDLPPTGTVMFSLLAASKDGRITQQLGYKMLDGKQIAYFTMGFGGPQNNLSGYPDTATPGQVTAVMPSAAVSSLRPEWHWSAVLNI